MSGVEPTGLSGVLNIGHYAEFSDELVKAMTHIGGTLGKIQRLVFKLK